MDARSREILIIEQLLNATLTAVRHQTTALEATKRLAVRLGSIRDDILDVESPKDDPLVNLVGRLTPKPKKPNDPKAADRARAKVGIRTIALFWRHDGWATVSVEDFTTLTLAPALGALLEQLIAVRDGDEDGFPVFVSKSTLQRAGGVAAHAAHARRPDQAIDQLVYRLRRQFARAHLNPWLIDTKDGGVRLLLRRAEPRTKAGTASEMRQMAVASRFGPVQMDR